MKKVFFALLGATAMTLIPTSVNAATQTNYDNGECIIVVNTNETANIGSTNCRIKVEQGGVLNINGAVIQKMTTFDGTDGNRMNDAAVLNLGGTVNMNSGKIYANYGYGIVNHNNGTVNVRGGIIHSVLHQAIHADNGTINISGGEVKGAIGGESAIQTYGTLNHTGGTINGKPAAQAVKASTSATNANEEITITVTTSEKPAATQANTTTPAKNTAKSTPVANTETTETKDEPIVEEKADEAMKVAAKVEPKAETEAEEEQTEEQTEAKANDINPVAVTIAAIATVLGGASAAIMINRLRH